MDIKTGTSVRFRVQYTDLHKNVSQALTDLSFDLLKQTVIERFELSPWAELSFKTKESGDIIKIIDQESL
jgi:hypothetical protein